MFTPSQLIERLWELLFQVNGATSVFGSSVFLSVMVATGLVGLRKNMNWDIAFASTCFAVAILPAALFSGNSGYDRDYRQALFALPFLTPMIARGVTSLRDFCLRGERRQSILICLILIAAFIFSFWTQLQHVRHENQPDLGKMLINDFAAGRVVEILLGLLFVLWLLIRLIDLAKNNQRGVKLKILS